MSYDAVDKVLMPWLKRHGLHVFTLYREGEVRSIDVVDDTGDRYQIDISMPDESGKIRVSAGNLKSKRKRKSQEYETDLLDLAAALEKAYCQIEDWVKQEGHTRTPVL